MKWLLVLLVVAGCGNECPNSPNVQVSFAADALLDLTLVARLRLQLSIDGQPARTLEFTLDRPLASGPHSILLMPDPAPATRYNVAVTIDALSASGALVAIGSAAGDVSLNGCNRLNARLTALPLVDGGVPPADFSVQAHDGNVAPVSDMPPLPPDLACIPGSPDEDGDSRPDNCDACPADADPAGLIIDSDNDGLPDVCDPEPQRPGNKLLYFAPFNINDGHWSLYTVQGGTLAVSTHQGTLISSNGIDQQPLGVRVQTLVTMSRLVGPAPNYASDVGIFLGNATDMNSPSANGAICTINVNLDNSVTLDLNPIVNGKLQNPVRSPFQAFSLGTAYRLRFLQHGGEYSCEAFDGSNTPVTVSFPTAISPPTGQQQYMSLHSTNVDAQYAYVVVESILP
jgi:hypothetical protein